MLEANSIHFQKEVPMVEVILLLLVLGVVIIDFLDRNGIPI